MKTPLVVCALAFLTASAPAQTIDVGTGAPTDSLIRSFQAAYIRNGFYTLVSVPPLGQVKKFGTNGLVQEFSDAAKTSGVKFALIDPNTTRQQGDGSDVFQVFGNMYGYYSGIGVNTAGNPTMDTASCPPSAPAACQFQLFDKNYALFAYLQAIANGQNFAVRDPFYTKWTAQGGLSSMGSAVSAEAAVTSPTGGVATAQSYSQGIILNITAGVLIGRLVAVHEPVYDVYLSNGGPTGFLGFPTGDELLLPNGNHRQTFEGGSIEYGPGSGAILKLPVATVAITSGGASLHLNLGDTLAVQATAFGGDGSQLDGRVFSFTTSNSRAVTVQANGGAAVLRAVGGGTAKITAVSEGKSSPAITVFVTAPCCQVGEGAPTDAIQQLFQDVISRNRLAVRIPAAGPVRRTGNGYVQELQPLDPNSSARYLITVSDRAALGHLVTGGILDKYDAFGGPAQSLGYPTGDAVYDAGRTPRQVFENGALAGNPVRLVSGAILQKWAALNYEAGPAGFPTGDLAAFVSTFGIESQAQVFQNGVIYAGLSGSQALKAYFVTGLIQAKYNSIGAARGELGLPITDEFVTSGNHRQDFEGGTLQYAPGDAEAKLTLKDRKPAVTAAPGTVVAGSPVRLTIAGFANGSTLRVSITGQPDFIVNTQTGSYFWDSYVPSNAASASVTVRAVDVADAGKTAQVTYTVKSAAEMHAQLTKVRGDSQTGVPGGLLKPIRIALRDDAGNPLAGFTVKFSATAGAQVVASSPVTDANGEAEASLRLPASEGIVLANAEAGRQVITFTARSAASTLANYPKLVQTGDAPLGNGTGTIAQKGSLLTAVASIVRFYQNRGDIPAPNGLADPGTLNQFLRTLCEFDSQGSQVCDGFVSPAGSQEQFVNLWRLGAFTANSLDVSIEKPDAAAIPDLLNGNQPVLVALALTANGVPVGAHFVVAIGVAADGTVQIFDPHPALNRSALKDYLAGFTAADTAWKGVVTGMVRLLPRSPSPTGFVVASSNKSIGIASQAGECGATVEWPGVIALAGPGAPSAIAPAAGTYKQRYCDGAQPVYAINLETADTFDATVTDLGSLGGRVALAGGGGLASFKATRPGAQLLITPQDLTFSSHSVVNAATFTSEIAPGSLISIFGNGLASAGTTTKVEINDKPATLLAAYPFQLNLAVPLDLTPGTQLLRVTSPYGVMEQSIEIQLLAPAIFRLDPGIFGYNRGATVNQDSKINSISNPAKRGSTVLVFGTGFGAVVRSGALSVTQAPVTAILNGQELPVAFAGLAPGFVGLYQMNLPVPVSTPPGLRLPLSFRVSGVESSPVEISIQ